MSRRPQEPPRSVSRHHRLVSLKRAGLFGAYATQHPLSIYSYECNFHIKIKTLRAASCTPRTLHGVQEISEEKIRKTEFPHFLMPC